MRTPPPWIVCEKSGRWAAALRVELTRQKAIHATPPRIYEVRSLPEFNAAMIEHAAALAFVEVRLDNLGQVLELLAAQTPRTTRFVAIVDHSESHTSNGERPPSPNWNRIAAALWEAGAAEVIASPRQLGPALSLAALHAATAAKRAVSAPDLASIADRAWASLPWQDG